MDNGASRASLCDGYVVEIDGEFNSEYGSITAALSAGLRLRRDDGGHEVRVCDAQERAPVTRAAGISLVETLDEHEGWAMQHVPTVS